jgi:UDP-2-acetamido-3-amino-2,3-dideoxy-glucuronate N-acetyltransferase
MMLLKREAGIGANSTIVCAEPPSAPYSFVCERAALTKDLADYALMVGNPARLVGWMSRHGDRLGDPDAEGVLRCPESWYRYKVRQDGSLGCLELPQEESLPASLSRSTRSYRMFKTEAVIL